MLELLCVIVVAASLITLAVRQYAIYQRETAMNLVTNDIVVLRGLLNDFYQKIPCDRFGQWQGDVDKNIIDQLGNSIQRKRLPFVNSYKVFVRPSSLKTKLGKPLYFLEIRAKVSRIYRQRIDWLLKRFGAKKIDGNALVWSALPQLAESIKSNKLWVLGASNAQFRLQQLHNISGLTMSHAYCAR